MLESFSTYFNFHSPFKVHAVILLFSSIHKWYFCGIDQVNPEPVKYKSSWSGLHRHPQQNWGDQTEKILFKKNWMSSCSQETNTFCFTLDETGLFKIKQVKHNEEEHVIKKERNEANMEIHNMSQIYHEFIQQWHLQG